MRVVVTGGAGFIGSNLVDRFIDAGWTVYVIDDLSTGVAANVNSAATLIQLDVTSSGLMDAIHEVQPEVVVHLAAQVSVTASIENPDHDWAVNVEGTRAVAEAAQRAGARRVLLASSAAVYGEPQELPLAEESPTSPAVPYGHSKLAAERVLSDVLRRKGIDFGCLRFANVYGPRQRAAGEGGVVAELCSRMVADVEPVIFGTGRQTRDFIYVGDVVNACFEAVLFEGVLARTGLNGPAYNISTGRATSLNTLVKNIQAITHYAGPIRYADARSGDVEASVLAPGKALQTFGWKAAVPIEDGLAATANWFIHHP